MLGSMLAQVDVLELAGPTAVQIPNVSGAKSEHRSMGC